MKYGYARISTKEQNLDMQIDALKTAGCEKIYKEIAKGARTDRPLLNKILNILQSGDVLIIWKFDRLGRSLQHLVKTFNDLIAKNINVISIKDPVDTTTPQGRLMFNIFSSLAEFEKEIIQERTQAGLKAARARGRLGGRKKGLSQKAMEKACAAESLYKEGKLTVIQIAKKLGISKTSLYKYLKIRNVPIGTNELLP